MHILFDIFFFMLIIFYLPGFILKRKLDKDFKERLAIYGRKKLNALKNKSVIWLHAVSVGETAASEAFLEGLKEEFPKSAIVVSNVTQTGKLIARKITSKEDVVIYFPFDISFVTKRAISQIRPAVFIMVDTEIWPNMIRGLSKRNIPIVLINGRISEKSFKGYMLLRLILQKTFERIDLLSMQTSGDAKRAEFLGARAECVETVGNIKFDSVLKLEKDLSKIKAKFKDLPNLSEDSKVFVAGSTHPGEEEILAKVFLRLKDDHKDIKLIIAPRHVERSFEIKKLFENISDAKVKLLTQLRSNDEAEVIIINKIGILKEAYALATVVFVGGSLVKHGGHNILEPAFFGKPIIFGPHMFNFQDIADLFLKKRAALVADDENSLYLASDRLFGSLKERASLGKRARAVIDENIGATEKTIDKLKFLLKDKGISL